MWNFSMRGLGQAAHGGRGPFRSAETIPWPPRVAVRCKGDSRKADCPRPTDPQPGYFGAIRRHRRPGGRGLDLPLARDRVRGSEGTRRRGLADRPEANDRPVPGRSRRSRRPPVRQSHRSGQRFLGTTRFFGRRSSAVLNREKLWLTKFTAPEMCSRYWLSSAVRSASTSRTGRSWGTVSNWQ